MLFEFLVSIDNAKIFRRCIDLQFGFMRALCLGKETKVKFGTVIHRTEGLLDLVHMDV